MGKQVAPVNKDHHGKSAQSGGLLERLTLKYQILMSYSVMAIVVISVSIAISLSLYENLSTKVISDSSSYLVSQGMNNVRDLAVNLADYTNEKLVTLKTSASEACISYSTTLLTTTDSTKVTAKVPFKMLNNFPTYAEFNFTEGCAQSGGCPEDYGPLSDRSSFRGSGNGSLLHTSTYIYSSALGRAVKTTEEWNDQFASSEALRDVRDALAVQDQDQQVMFLNSDSALTFIFLGAKVIAPDNSYHAVLRTYPGVTKTTDSNTYDHTTRPWFKLADREHVLWFGPFLEFFTKEMVLSLSYKETLTYLNHSLEIVASTLMAVDSFRQIAHSVQLQHDGFAAVYNKETNEVLAWSNRTDLVNEDTGRFKTIFDMDPKLPADFCSESSFEYVGSDGKAWLAGCAESFDATIAVTSSTTQFGKGIGVIVFARKSLVLDQLVPFQDNVDSSEATLHALVIPIVLGISIVAMALVIAVARSITLPLETMRAESLQVIDVMSEDVEVRDFSSIVNNAGFVDRTDEVGVLASDFLSVICVMHNKLVNKRLLPIYPSNPWYLQDDEMEDTSCLSWKTLKNHETVRPLPPPAAQVRQVAAVEESTDRSVQKSSLRSLFPRSASNATASKTSFSGSRRRKVKSLEAGTVVEITPSKSVGWLTCLKTQLTSLGLMLLLAAGASMLITVYLVTTGGQTWSDKSASLVLDTQQATLLDIVSQKAVFVESFIGQMTLDVMTVKAAYTSINSGEFSRPSWEADGDYLHSYSLESPNPYSQNPQGGRYTFSSYFSMSAAKCWTTTPQTCDVIQNRTMTRLSSLADIKLSSLVTSPGSYLSFIQTGHEDDGFTRYWPMRYQSPSFSQPTSCQISTRDVPLCAVSFANSRCGNPAAASFPVYDARCRSWYGAVRQSPDVDAPSFIARRASDGVLVYTAAMAFFNETSEDRMGVVALNFFVTVLEKTINENPILQSGYTYILDATNVDAVLLHPKQSLTCGTLQCAENMTDSEYAAFKSDVLLAGMDRNSDYFKKGKKWLVAIQALDVGNVHYLVVGTVPSAELVGFTVSVQDSIDEMIIAFTIAIAVVMGCIVLMVAQIVRLITAPLDDLRTILQMALRQDFSKELPKHSGSVDLAGLNLAIAQLLVALKLDSMRSSTDLGSMKTVLEESITLFTALGNNKGMGNSLSNLATVELAMGQFQAARKHMEQSVEIAKEVISSLERGFTKDADVEKASGEKGKELQRAKITLSDRQGKLALILLELQEQPSAVSLLEQLLEFDRSILYVRGCIEKQSALGHHYLHSGQLDKAEKVFASSLKLLQDLQHVQGVSACEASAYEMLALYDLAVLEDSRNWHASEEVLRKLESKYIAALMVPAYMDESIVKRVLRSLVRLYSRSPQLAEGKKLVQGLADKHGLKLSPSGGNELIVSRRVVFVVDFSSSMAGSRIRAVKDGMHSLLQNSLCDLDSLAILSFNNSVQEVVPLAVLGKNVNAVAKRIETLVAPVGGKALYDGVARALEMLKPETSSDVLVVLTNGPDDKSKAGLDSVLRSLSSSLVSVIALALGKAAPDTALQQIVQNGSGSFLAQCVEGKEDIADLFHAASLRLHATSFRLEDF